MASFSELSDEDFFTKILEVIAQELEVDVQELQDDELTDFVELGMGPALVPITMRKINQTTGMKLPNSLFEECSDLQDLKRHILLNRPTSNTPGRAATTSDGATAQSSSRLPPQSTPDKPHLSVLVRGSSSKNGNKNFFLLPDGSGSAMAYARIPALSSTYNLYALNSPFLGPEHTLDFGCTVEALAAIWAQEIALLQPHGPYVLGGWSAGGYYAFEVTKYFQKRGEIVERLVLIDSPPRTTFEAMPLAVVEHLGEHNLMGNWGGAKGTTPQWLVDHFTATLKAVDEYTPAAITSVGNVPEVYVIWAKDALLSEEQAEKTGLDMTVKVSRFLLKRRDSFGGNGWEMLFPYGTKMNIATMPGHHFNIVHQPNVSELYSSEFCISMLPGKYSS